MAADAPAMAGFLSHPFAPPPGRYGFAPVAGPGQGLLRFVLATGRVPPGDLHPLHRHRGDEVIHVLEGRVLFRLGDARRILEAGEVVAVPPGTWHGMRAITGAALAVIAELGMGAAFAARGPDGGLAGVEVHRRDMPWSLPPPPGGDWTDDAALAALKAAATALDPLDDAG